MAQDKLSLIYDILVGKDTVTPALGKSGKAAKGLTKGIKTANASFKAMGSAAGGILKSVFSLKSAFLAIGAGAVFTKAIKESVKLQNSLVGLQSVAGATGNDVNSITEAAKELAADGMIPLTDVSGALKSLLASGIGAPEAIKVFKSLRDAASFNRQGQLDLGEAIRGAADGIKNQNSIMVDNAGITKNLSVLQKEYAASIGTTVGKLSESQKRQAIVNGIIKEGALFTGDYEKSLGTFSGQLTKVSGNFKFFLAEIGDLVTKSPQIITAVKGLSKAMQTLRGFLKENQKALRNLVTKGFSFVVESVAFVVKAISKISVAIKGVGTSIQSFTSKAATFFKARRFKQLTSELAALNKENAANFGEATKTRIKAIKTELFQLNSILTAHKQLTKGQSDEYREQSELAKNFRKTISGVVKDITEATSESVTVKAKIKIDPAAAQETEVSILASLKSVGNKFINGLETALGDRKSLVAIGSSISGAVAAGADGARGLLVEGVGAGLDLIAPGLGQVAKPIIDVLSQGPEKTKEMVRGFIDAIPKLIDSLIEALPVLLEELAIGLTEVIFKLADKADVIINGLLKAIVKSIPVIAVAFAKVMTIGAFKFIFALIKAIPKLIVTFTEEIVKGAGKFVEEIVKGAGEFVSEIFKGIGKSVGIGGGGGGAKGGGVGSLVGQAILGPIGAVGGAIGGLFGFAKGGEVPAGFPNDTFPARLSSGETVIDRSTTDAVKENLTGGGQAEILNAILGELKKPQQVQSSITIDNKVFANLILSLNRNNQRLA